MPDSVVIIGAGINGLVAANYLRRAGCDVTVFDRADRPGGACISEVADIDGQLQQYALGASVLGLMQDFVFQETGLAGRLETYVPAESKRVYFPERRAVGVDPPRSRSAGTGARRALGRTRRRRRLSRR